MYIKQLINCNKKENLQRLNERDNFKVFTRLVEDLFFFMSVTNTVRIVLLLLSRAKSRFLSTIMRSAQGGGVVETEENFAWRNYYLPTYLPLSRPQPGPFDKVRQLPYRQIVGQGFHPQVPVRREENHVADDVTNLSWWGDEEECVTDGKKGRKER